MLIEEEEEEEEEIVAKIPSCSLTCEIVDFCRVCNQNLWRRKKESKIRLRRRLKVMKTKKKDKVENDTQSYDHRVQRQENESECQVRERKKKKTFSASSKCVANDLFSRLRLPAKRSESQSSALSASIYQSQSLLFCNLLLLASVSDCVN